MGLLHGPTHPAQQAGGLFALISSLTCPHQLGQRGSLFRSLAGHQLAPLGKKSEASCACPCHGCPCRPPPRPAGEGASNIVPDAVALSGTIRAFGDDVFRQLRRRVGQVFADTAAMYGCNASVAWSPVSMLRLPKHAAAALGELPLMPARGKRAATGQSPPGWLCQPQRCVRVWKRWRWGSGAAA